MICCSIVGVTSLPLGKKEKNMKEMLNIRLQRAEAVYVNKCLRAPAEYVTYDVLSCMLSLLKLAPWGYVTVVCNRLKTRAY